MPKKIMKRKFVENLCTIKRTQKPRDDYYYYEALFHLTQQVINKALYRIFKFLLVGLFAAAWLAPNFSPP